MLGRVRCFRKLSYMRVIILGRGKVFEGARLRPSRGPSKGPSRGNKVGQVKDQVQTS
jgi:hypothetical protein